MTTSFSEKMSKRTQHIDREWLNAATTELTLRGVSTGDMVAAMMEVESHMAENGGDVREVFGNPKEYAAALEMPEAKPLGAGDWLQILAVPIFLGGGFLTLLHGVLGLFGGEGTTISAVAVLVAASIALQLALLKFGGLRLFMERPAASVIGLIVVVALVGLSLNFLPGPVIPIEGWVAIGVGAVGTVIGLVVLGSMTRANRRQAQATRFPA